MPDNVVDVIFNGVDHVSPVVDAIERKIGPGANVPGILRDSTFGETDPKTVAFLKEMRGKFAEASKSSIELTENVQEFDTVSTASFAKAGIAIAAVGAAVGFVGSQLNDVVQLSKDRPELFTEEELRRATEYGNTIDDVKESLTKIKVSAATRIMPGIAEDLRGLSDLGAGWKLIAELDFAGWRKWRDDIKSGGGISTELEKAADAASSFDRAIQNQTGTHIKLRAEITEDKEALKALSAEYKTLLSNMFSIQSTNDNFVEGEKRRAETLEELEQKKIKLAIEKNAVQAAGNLTIAKRSEYALRQIELDNQINKIQEDGVKAIEDKEKAGKRLVYNMLEQRAAADGLISSDEVKFLQDTAVGFGLVDRKSADTAITAAMTADTMWAGFEKVNNPMSTTADLMDRIAAKDGQIVNFGVNFQTFGALAFGAAATGSANYGATGRGGIALDYLAQEVGRRNTRY